MKNPHLTVHTTLHTELFYALLCVTCASHQENLPPLSRKQYTNTKKRKRKKKREVNVEVIHQKSLC